MAIVINLCLESLLRFFLSVSEVVHSIPMSVAAGGEEGFVVVDSYILN